MNFPAVTLQLPEWIETFLDACRFKTVSQDERMRLVIAMARKNIELTSGGPFAAAVFEMHSGRLIAPGVNIVVKSSCSIAHAEMVALSVAQKVIGTFDLGAKGLPGYELVTSTAPCAMCLGAIPWSGIRRVICGARDEDARRIGFDEGSKVKNWVEALTSRNIEVIEDVCRSEAVAVLNSYKETGGPIYNSRDGIIEPTAP
ncbi:MAG: nucleoside deaminase [Fibrobacter sp.]|nr:nucleoside deaminase [Fibrobacter sp.]